MLLLARPLEDGQHHAPRPAPGAGPVVEFMDPESPLLGRASHEAGEEGGSEPLQVAERGKVKSSLPAAVWASPLRSRPAMERSTAPSPERFYLLERSSRRRESVGWEESPSGVSPGGQAKWRVTPTCRDRKAKERIISEESAGIGAQPLRPCLDVDGPVEI